MGIQLDCKPTLIYENLLYLRFIILKLGVPHSEIMNLKYLSVNDKTVYCVTLLIISTCNLYGVHNKQYSILFIFV